MNLFLTLNFYYQLLILKNDVEKERLDKQKKDNYNLLVSVV